MKSGYDLSLALGFLFLVLGFMIMPGTRADAGKSELTATPELENEERGFSARTFYTEAASATDKHLVNNFGTSTLGIIQASIVWGGLILILYYAYMIRSEGRMKPSAAYQSQYKQYLGRQEYTGQLYTQNSR